jgi:hypothetical protein
MSNEQPSFTCPKCDRTSYHPKDLEHRFCGNCNEFFTKVFKMKNEKDYQKLPLVSNRDIPLVHADKPQCDYKPVIVAELWSKWYCLFLVTKIRFDVFKVEPLHYHVIGDETSESEYEPEYMDHVVNPKRVMEYAAKMGYCIDDASEEMMVGRWHMESLSQYDNIGSQYETEED